MHSSAHPYKSALFTVISCLFENPKLSNTKKHELLLRNINHLSSIIVQEHMYQYLKLYLTNSMIITHSLKIEKSVQHYLSTRDASEKSLRVL
jgi:DNA gyrase/topoisomerase IV subunit B